MKNFVTLSGDYLIDVAIGAILSAQDHYALQKNYHSARKLLAESRATRIDLFLISTFFDDMGIFDFTKRLRLMHKDAKILILSHINYYTFMNQILALGIDGYLPISSTEEEFKAMIGNVMKSESFNKNPPVFPVKQYAEMEQKDIFVGMNPREMDILLFLLKGYSVKPIAKILHLSPKTISTYKANIYKRLEITNIIDLYLSLVRKETSNCF